VSYTHDAVDLRNRALASLPDADRDLLSPHFHLVQLKKGDELVQQGDRVTSVHFPLAGMISTIVSLSDGSSVETAMAGPEGILGLSSLGVGRALGTNVVQCSGEAYVLDPGHLFRAAHASSAVARMVHIAADVSSAYSLQSIACLNSHQMEARFCRWMLMARYHMQTDAFSLTHEFLAAMLGVQRSSLSLVVNKLDAEGLISHQRGEVAILDVDGLKRSACECYREVIEKIDAAYPETIPVRG
jgi:CRP-like cAMP-binding protein